MRVSATVAISWWLVLLSLVATLASATLVRWNDELLAVHSSSIEFRSAVVGLPTIEYGRTAIKCDLVETATNSGQVTVLVAISRCLNASSLAVIEAWVSSIKATRLEYLENGVKKKLTFATTLIRDQCTPTSVSTAALLSDEVLPDEVARMQAFARFGRVLQQAPASWNAVPIGMISFVNNRKSYDYVTQYENRFNISKTFRFQFCQSGGTCSLQSTVALDTNVDLFLYNPFKLASSSSCSKLTDGIAVEYVNTTGARDCFCTCTAKSQIEDTGAGKRCVASEPETCPCEWNTMGGFVITNKENLTQCKLSKLASGRGLPVPTPRDNYVANKVNTDELTTGPRIEVSITPVFSTVYEYVGTKTLNASDLPQKVTDMISKLGEVNTRVRFTPTVLRGQSSLKAYTWIDFGLNGKAKIDDMTMTAYGMYDLLLTAYDYSNPAAQCVGCVVFVDGFRPKRTTQCPTAIRDTTVQATVPTAELTTANVAKVTKLVSDFYDVQLNATNDACSSSTSQKQRCDYEDFKLKTFFSADYVAKTAAESKTFFAMTEIEADLKKGALTNPLEAKARDGTACEDSVFVPPTACTRCGRYESRLQEYWTDYRCGYDYSMQYCSGDANETCVLHQCLALIGPSIATVSAAIKPSIVTDSKTVFSKLTAAQQTGVVTTTQVLRALSCSSLGFLCNYKSRLVDLFDVSVTNKLGGSTSTFVFWRYMLDCERDTVGWRLWNPSSTTQVQHIFSDKSTQITIEAWTACGIVNKWTFSINLYVTIRGRLYLSHVDEKAIVSEPREETTPLLLVVCAAVAVVAALVALRRWRAREVEPESTVALEDAYSPLLH